MEPGSADVFPGADAAGLHDIAPPGLDDPTHRVRYPRSNLSVSQSVLPHIARMAGYVTGEQPQGGGFIKLNTNENPYPPSQRVKSALVAAVTDRLRLYPDPVATEFRKVAA